jgi:predicted RNA methylase
MNLPFPAATSDPVATTCLTADPAAAIHVAALYLLADLENGRRIDSVLLRTAMETSFEGSDASGAWDWKTAYDACEAATVLFLRKYGHALLRKAGSTGGSLALFEKIAKLLPTHTRRSAESQAFQQFSTPIALGLAAVTAAAITAQDRVLEPSAGTGLLAILAEISGGSLVLNELAAARARLLTILFPALAVTRFDAAQIDDHLDPAIVPTVVLMNPPFSALANVEGRVADAVYRHVNSALARLADGGRLVAITSANFGPERPVWRDAFMRLQEHGRVVFTATIAGSVYAKHGTTIETRLTVIDKAPAEDLHSFWPRSVSRRMSQHCSAGSKSTCLRGSRSPTRSRSPVSSPRLARYAAISHALPSPGQGFPIRLAWSSSTKRSTGLPTRAPV